MRAVRLVQVGLGGWGLNWAEEVLPKIERLGEVAFVEVDEAARSRAIEAGLPARRVFADLDTAIAETKPQAMLATVPLAVHAPVARAGLERGLHVLVEKPFTETLAEARELVALAESRDLLLAVNQNYRYFPAVQGARAAVAEGRVGTPHFLRVHYARLFDAGYRYFFLSEPLLSDMAIHHFDAMRFILQDEPAAVSCLSWTEAGTPYHGPPAAVATIRFAGGTVVQYDGSWISRGPGTAYGAEWHLDGSAGAMDWTFRRAGRDRSGLDRIHLHRPDMPVERLPLPKVPFDDRAGVLDAFTAFVANDTLDPALATGRDNLKSLGLMFAAIASSKANGAWMEIAA